MFRRPRTVTAATITIAAMNPAVDPWVITARERAKYVEQFRALKPDGKGFVVGAQVREFFLQSQLQPLVLGEIW